jgi:hypothetical protein
MDPSPPSTTKSWTRIESRELSPVLPRNAAEIIEPRPLLQPVKTALAGVPWRRLGTWSLFFLWLSMLSFVLFLLVVWEYMVGMATVFSSHDGCQPDGTFSPFVDAYSSWSSAGIFQITMGFGELSFTEAKIIDIVWDVVSMIRPRHLVASCLH